MPVTVDSELVKLSQDEFADIAYNVMNAAFQVHRELGPLFSEIVYQKALVTRLSHARTEVKIDVSFKDFSKPFFMDLVVAGGAVFELKASTQIGSQHHGQLQNYLLLAGLHHGKIINFRTAQVEHKFVNTTLTHADRTAFKIDDIGWHPTQGFGISEKLLVSELIKDWGTGLTRTLYNEAVLHFLVEPQNCLQEINVVYRHEVIAKQSVNMCARNIAISLTTLEHGAEGHHNDMLRLLNNTELSAIQWINISRKILTFMTLK